MIKSQQTRCGFLTLTITSGTMDDTRYTDVINGNIIIVCVCTICFCIYIVFVPNTLFLYPKTFFVTKILKLTDVRHHEGFIQLSCVVHVSKIK